jgi:hypothetical protein
LEEGGHPVFRLALIASTTTYEANNGIEVFR